ncbi:MAG: hypothetical protein ABIJ09_16245 [Pseudomonadota bacterium]
MGQLGNGTVSSAIGVPGSVCHTGFGPACTGAQQLNAVVALDSLSEHSCVLTNTGEISCWGFVIPGLGLGDGTTVNERHTPFTVVDNGGVSSRPLEDAAIRSCTGYDVTKR